MSFRSKLSQARAGTVLKIDTTSLIHTNYLHDGINDQTQRQNDQNDRNSNPSDDEKDNNSPNFQRPGQQHEHLQEEFQEFRSEQQKQQEQKEKREKTDFILQFSSFSTPLANYIAHIPPEQMIPSNTNQYRIEQLPSSPPSSSSFRNSYNSSNLLTSQHSLSRSPSNISNSSNPLALAQISPNNNDTKRQNRQKNHQSNKNEKGLKNNQKNNINNNNNNNTSGGGGGLVRLSSQADRQNGQNDRQNDHQNDRQNDRQNGQDLNEFDLNDDEDLFNMNNSLSNNNINQFHYGPINQKNNNNDQNGQNNQKNHRNQKNNQNQKNGSTPSTSTAATTTVAIDELLLNLYSNPWYRLNQAVTTSTPLNLSSTSPLLTLSAQTANSVNPYREIKHRFGSTVLLPPQNQHKSRILKELEQGGRLPSHERSRLMALYSREGQQSILAPGVDLPNQTGFQLHFCEEYTLNANNLKNKTKLTPNSILYYCFLSTDGFQNNLKRFENIQLTHDHNQVIDFCMVNHNIPQCSLHLSYIWEYWNKISLAFDYIRSGVAIFEKNFLNQDILFGLFCGKIKFLPIIPHNELIKLTTSSSSASSLNIGQNNGPTGQNNGPNGQNNQQSSSLFSTSTDIKALQKANSELCHAFSKIMARYAHFLTKKAASGSAFGITQLASTTSNHTFIATTLDIASFFNLQYKNVQKYAEMIKIGPFSSISTILEEKMPILGTENTNYYLETDINTLKDHLSYPIEGLNHSLSATSTDNSGDYQNNPGGSSGRGGNPGQFDQGSLNFFRDYYGLKGTRYLDVILTGLHSFPHFFGSGTFDICQSVFSPVEWTEIIKTGGNSDGGLGIWKDIDDDEDDDKGGKKNNNKNNKGKKNNNNDKKNNNFFNNNSDEKNKQLEEKKNEIYRQLTEYSRDTTTLSEIHYAYSCGILAPLLIRYQNSFTLQNEHQNDKKKNEEKNELFHEDETLKNISTNKDDGNDNNNNQNIDAVDTVDTVVDTVDDVDTDVTNHNYITPIPQTVPPPPNTIYLTQKATAAIFPLIITPSRWALNWSYSIAYAMAKLEQSYVKLTQKYQNQQQNQQNQYNQHNYMFGNYHNNNNNGQIGQNQHQQQQQQNIEQNSNKNGKIGKNDVNWLDISHQIDYVSKIDLITLLSLEVIIPHDGRPVIGASHYGLQTTMKGQLEIDEQIRILSSPLSSLSSSPPPPSSPPPSSSSSSRNFQKNNNENLQKNEKKNTSREIYSSSSSPSSSSSSSSPNHPKHPLSHILNSQILNDASLSYTPLTSHQNINTIGNSGGNKGKNMNGLGTVIGNNKYKNMLLGLIPVTFTSMAYLARAIILFPEVIQAMCESGQNNNENSSNQNNNNNNNDDENLNNNDNENDQNNSGNNTYIKATDLSTNSKLQYLIDMYYEPEGGIWNSITSFATGEKKSQKKNNYFEKATMVYSLRCGQLWKQTNMQKWIQGGITTAYNIVIKFQNQSNNKNFIHPSSLNFQQQQKNQNFNQNSSLSLPSSSSPLLLPQDIELQPQSSSSQQLLPSSLSQSPSQTTSPALKPDNPQSLPVSPSSQTAPTAPATAVLKPDFYQTLNSLFVPIRSMIYNNDYYQKIQHPLKSLEQSDYCDDIVVFDNNTLFADNGGMDRQEIRRQAILQQQVQQIEEEFMQQNRGRGGGRGGRNNGGQNNNDQMGSLGRLQQLFQMAQGVIGGGGPNDGNNVDDANNIAPNRPTGRNRLPNQGAGWDLFNLRGLTQGTLNNLRGMFANGDDRADEGDTGSGSDEAEWYDSDGDESTHTHNPHGQDFTTTQSFGQNNQNISSDEEDWMMQAALDMSRQFGHIGQNTARNAPNRQNIRTIAPNTSLPMSSALIDDLRDPISDQEISSMDEEDIE